MLPLVSIVVTTKNEEKNIANCLKSILKQKYPQNRIEIIVVDNYSQDHTQKIARKYTDKVFNQGPERSAQRNFGAKKASGKYYLYLDADMILSADVVQTAVDKLEKNKNTLGLYIPEIILGNQFWSKARRFERSFYNATVIDCARFIRMQDFLAVQGFDETMSGPEDWDFDKKIRNKGKVDLIQAEIYHNEKNFKLKKYLAKKNYYSKSFNQYIQKWGKKDSDIKKQLGFFYRYFGVFFENGKWKKLFKHPALTIGMYFLKILVGVNYLFIKK